MKDYSGDFVKLKALWDLYQATKEDNDGHPPPALAVMLHGMITEAMAVALSMEESELTDTQKITQAMIIVMNNMILFGLYMSKNGFSYNELTPCTCHVLTEDDIAKLLNGK